jgi:uncharacterized protein YbjT (DUF2867 family)
MYVVTGASGNTGKIVAERLLAHQRIIAERSLGQPKKVRVIGRNPERLEELAARGAEPFVADITDEKAIARAFSGAEAIYAMIPPNLTTSDVHGYRDQVIAAIAGGIENNDVKHAVVLSSVGADKADKTGPVVGLHKLEQRLNQIAGLNAVYLRAGYFMENILAQAGTIRGLGKTAGPLRGDLKLPLIATRDIATVAADILLKLDFTGHSARELLGQRDIDYNGVTAVIGKAIGQPDLSYVQLPDAQIRPALEQLGMSANFVDLLLEMTAALNSGYMRPLEKRTPQNSTPTSIETFVADTFVPAYKRNSRAA